MERIAAAAAAARVAPAAALAADARDNAAVAARELAAGERVTLVGGSAALRWRVLEGHRLAARPIARGERLLSWGRPFGVALRDIALGEPLCNAKALAALAARGMAAGLPSEPNFADCADPPPDRAALADPASGIRVGGAGANVLAPKVAQNLRFRGLRRAGARGVGTRNALVVIGTSNRAAPLARAVAAALDTQLPPGRRAGLDCVVPVAHTEDGAGNNRDLLLRALGAFVVHPNIAGAMVLSLPDDPISSAVLRQHLVDCGRAEQLAATPHCFLDLPPDTPFDAMVARATRVALEDLAPHACAAANCTRAPEPISELKVALQCGGSDAFSGLTANPLVGAVAREIVQRGGSALLAETDELIGAEPYVLAKVRSFKVAEKFLDMTDRIKDLLSWHGVSAEGNPSGGNLLRGLYNITIKSLGAATKKAPDLQLDGVLDYAENMDEPGFLFMHSPGNDLESVAGQVASGCNMVFFTTGNGSVTNFPFVPTIKVVTTTARFNLLANDMDFNAGRLFDAPGAFEELTDELLQVTLLAAGGRRTAGELAPHAPQVVIWRDWCQTGQDSLASFCKEQADQRLAGPLEVHDIVACRPQSSEHDQFPLPDPHKMRAGRVTLVVPTSLCSSEVARTVAERLSATFGPAHPEDQSLRVAVALPHSEGCGSNYGHARFGFRSDLPDHAGEGLLDRILLGHVGHPHVSGGVLLEHGCEINHNDRMALKLQEAGHAPWPRASVQLDGGVDAVIQRCLALLKAPSAVDRDSCNRVRPLSVGVLVASGAEPHVANQVAPLVAALVQGGANVIAFTSLVAMLVDRKVCPALRFAEGPGHTGGLWAMESLTGDWLEQVTGLASAGVDIILAWGTGGPLAGHPFVPLLQIGSRQRICDVVLPVADEEDETQGTSAAGQILAAIQQVFNGQLTPRCLRDQNVGFQITRGLIGVSV